ncbi:zinc knuckle containing protein [Venturia nashicola]|nr:zinc knuckle containing protein [Venturia nashicola]
MQSTLWPVRPSVSVNDRPYSRILKQVDEEARVVTTAETWTSEGEESEAEEDAPSEPEDAPCPEHEVHCVEIPQHHLVQVQKRRKALRGGAQEQDSRVSDAASIRSKTSTTKRRPAPQPGILESLFLPRTTRPSTARRRSTTDIKGKAAPVPTPETKAKARPSNSESTKAPSISSKRSSGSISTPQTLRKSPSRSISLFASPPPASPPVKFECITCLDDVPARRTARLECKHRMCHSCLKRVFTLSTTDPQLMPPRCCTEKEIPLAHVDKLFDVKFKLLWNRKFAEYATKNRLYCPRKGCGIWIKPKYIGKDKTTGREIGICKECKTEVCKKCNMKWHGRRECDNDEGTKRVLELGKEQGWKRCYNCREMVQLAEGCNHLRCRCKAEFCMVCAKKWKTCDCPWFNLPQELNVENARMPFGFPGDMPPRPPHPNGRRVENQWQALPLRVLGNLPAPPPPPPFRDGRDDLFDSLELPTFLEPILGATMRPRARRARPAPTSDHADREEQEAADADLARQLQEQELGTTLNEEDDFASSERRQRARRARRRVYAVTEDNNIHRLEEEEGDAW